MSSQPRRWSRAGAWGASKGRPAPGVRTVSSGVHGERGGSEVLAQNLLALVTADSDHRRRPRRLLEEAVCGDHVRPRARAHESPCPRASRRISAIASLLCTVITRSTNELYRR